MKRNRTLRRVEQADRDRSGPRSDRVIRAHTVSVQDDDLSQRKRIEKLWEQSINFFIETEGDADGKA